MKRNSAYPFSNNQSQKIQDNKLTQQKNDLKSSQSSSQSSGGGSFLRRFTIFGSKNKSKNSDKSDQKMYDKCNPNQVDLNNL